MISTISAGIFQSVLDFLGSTDSTLGGGSRSRKILRKDIQGCRVMASIGSIGILKAYTGNVLQRVGD